MLALRESGWVGLVPFRLLLGGFCYDPRFPQGAPQEFQHRGLDARRTACVGPKAPSYDGDKMFDDLVGSFKERIRRPKFSLTMVFPAKRTAARSS
jgi:hypothetical protein